MWADCDAERQARGLGDDPLDGGVSHALAGIGRQPERPRDIGQRVGAGRRGTRQTRKAILRVRGLDTASSFGSGQNPGGELKDKLRWRRRGHAARGVHPGDGSSYPCDRARSTISFRLFESSLAVRAQQSS